jgi:hypothetical protein
VRESDTEYSAYSETHDIVVDKIPSAVIVVVVSYTDGGTFGCKSGYGHIAYVGVDPEEAKAVVTAIEADTYTSSDYLPWIGYFAHIDSVDTLTVPVVDN